MNKDKKNVCIGLLAHVDAGKTTLSEALLYQAGVIEKPGRVDKGDAYLDTFAMEKERGITIFSQAGSFFVGGYAGDVVGYAGAYRFFSGDGEDITGS